MATELSDEISKIAELNDKIALLEEENRHLAETVSWMHKLIWDMYKRIINSGTSDLCP